MGRRKTYDRDDVVAGAMRVFWHRGYEATTIQELERTLRVNRYSLFAEFGSKEGLFEAALATYEAVVIGANLAAMEAPGAGLEDVVAFLERFRGGTDEDARAGCMLCNAAVERAPDSVEVQRRAVRYFERLQTAVHHALRESLAEPARTATAAALASAVLGAFLQARGGASADARGETIDGLVLWVRTLAQDPAQGA